MTSAGNIFPSFFLCFLTPIPQWEQLPISHSFLGSLRAELHGVSSTTRILLGKEEMPLSPQPSCCVWVLVAHPMFLESPGCARRALPVFHPGLAAPGQGYLHQGRGSGHLGPSLGDRREFCLAGFGPCQHQRPRGISVGWMSLVQAQDSPSAPGALPNSC